jgi:hypothetical protein
MCFTHSHCGPQYLSQQISSACFLNPCIRCSFMDYLQYRVRSLCWEDVSGIICVPPEVGAYQQTTRRQTENYSNTVSSALETSNLTWQSFRLNHEFERLIKMNRGLDIPKYMPEGQGGGRGSPSPAPCPKNEY